MKILVLGGDGYLGWPMAMHFSAKGDDVMIVDNFVKRRIELENGIQPLEPIPTLHRRVALWREVSGKDVQLEIGDLLNHRFIYQVLRDFQPDTIVHFAEQPSAPYSMQDRGKAVFTQENNVIGTLNLLFAMKSHCPGAHLIKLGTMGEYGTPDIDIEEGYITITHNGRTDTLPFPKQPGSFYHLSKVHDSHNLLFACRTWGLHVTDLNQGVVYGIETDQTRLHPGLRTSFHYDAVFGTVLNRFCAQAVSGVPLTVYGKGGQTRGFLNIRDTLQCVDISARNPAGEGEFRVFNQFTEVFSILDLAELVSRAGFKVDIDVSIDHVHNPRVESEEHYYNPKHSKLQDLGLVPNLLSDVLVEQMMGHIGNAHEHIDPTVFQPNIAWKR
jgi:UDP-sulfoquinovose synthase